MLDHSPVTTAALDELFPSPEHARGKTLAPVGSERRRVLKKTIAPLIDLGLRLRQKLRGLGRVMDEAANRTPPRNLLVVGIYKPEGAAEMAAAISAMRRSRHWVRVALGATGATDPALADDTVAEWMEGGKFTNVNRLLDAAGLEDAEWVVIIDDDVRLPKRFCDRLIAVAESARLDLAQPAQSRRSDAAWQIVRRRPYLLRITNFVEIGPLTLMSREVTEALTPFPEDGMGWGLDLHWGALGRERGWRLAVIDALALRHESRPPAIGYDRDAAMAAARAYLERNSFVTREEAETPIECWGTLPRTAD
jgi:hypothetical protein